MQIKYNYQDFTEEIKTKKIDFFISSSSFERRCFIITELLINIGIKKAIFYYNGNEIKQITNNADKLCQLFKDNSKKFTLNSDEPLTNFSVIGDSLKEITLKNTKPNILVDTTTFTHETLLILLRVIELSKDLFGKIYIAYVGAKTYSIQEQDTNKKWLSKGIKTIRTILGYPGYTDPTQKNHLVILFGFESERTKKIIEEYEYDYVSLGFGKIDKSIQNDHQKLNYCRHKILLKEYPNAKGFDFSLINPFETKKNILEHISKPEYSNLNTVLAPLNNKISTIGAGLAAILNQNIQLAYAQPLIYNTTGYSEPNEDIYFQQLVFDE